jgi:N-acetylglucosamine-6-phosphate deacetylase
MILSGATVVLPDRQLVPGTIVVEGGRLIDVVPGTRPLSGPDDADLSGFVIVPAFIDVHVHGVGGYDVLQAPGNVATMARLLPRYGVGAFCPTTIACGPRALRRVLDAVGGIRRAGDPGAARVLALHLESNFLSPEYCGAQPEWCLRLPSAGASRPAQPPEPDGWGMAEPDYSGPDIVAEIERGVADVGIVTLAPELPGALDLTARLVSLGVRVSLGHSAASFEEGSAAIAAGARHATHLFNRMPRLGHRDPGLVGAILAHDEVSAELICDGHHVHPALVRTTTRAKGAGGVMAITDATSVSGLAPGSVGMLGTRTILAGAEAAHLEDGTLAGSTCTMDRVFRVLTGRAGLGLVEAAVLCSSTPARQLGLSGHGAIVRGAAADLTVLDRDLQVARTYIGGRLVFAAA